MQTAIDNVAAEEVHEDPGATKEHYGAQNQSTVVNGKDHAVLREVLPLVSRRREGSEQGQGNDRQQRQQVKQNRAAAQKILSHFQPEDGGNLSQPKRPGDGCFGVSRFDSIVELLMIFKCGDSSPLW